MDCKTTGAFRQGGHDLGVEVTREFFPMAAHELDLDVTPGLDGMVGAYLAVFGRQLYQTAGTYGITQMFPFEPRELQRDRLWQRDQGVRALGQKEIVLPANPPGIVDADGLLNPLGRDLDLPGHLD